MPANVNTQLYLVPPKPDFNRQTGYQLIDYNTNSYRLSVANNGGVPISGKIQVGVMKGNLLCDPGCFPVDSGFLTLARISLGGVAGIQVFEYENQNLDSGSSRSIEVSNPDVRNDANSAFIIRWSPDYNKIPYSITTDIGGIKKTSMGEFESSRLSEVRKIVYNVVRDFGYLGSVEFRSAASSGSSVFSGGGGVNPVLQSPVTTSITMSPSAYSEYYGNSITVSGRLTDESGIGVADAVVYLKEDVTLGFDRELASTISDNSGRYSMSWNVDDIGDISIYTIFEGSTDFFQARSRDAVITGLQKQFVEQPPETQFYTTSISMEVSSIVVSEGEELLISGWLKTSDGYGVQGAAIYIKDEDAGSGDDDIALVYTDSSGYYSYSWPARPMDPFDDVVEIYSVFE
ncbi:MAG: carboxypeptidase-like regulatory domain-containing protein, partial [Nitrososphaerales archaeon]